MSDSCDTEPGSVYNVSSGDCTVRSAEDDDTIRQPSSGNAYVITIPMEGDSTDFEDKFGPTNFNFRISLFYATGTKDFYALDQFGDIVQKARTTATGTRASPSRIFAFDRSEEGDLDSIFTTFGASSWPPVFNVGDIAVSVTKYVYGITGKDTKYRFKSSIQTINTCTVGPNLGLFIDCAYDDETGASVTSIRQLFTINYETGLDRTVQVIEEVSDFDENDLIANCSAIFNISIALLAVLFPTTIQLSRHFAFDYSAKMRAFSEKHGEAQEHRDNTIRERIDIDSEQANTPSIPDERETWNS